MPKNAIFIMLDSFQFNYMGCYGNKWMKTPNIDRLAKEAMVFDNAYTEGLPTIPCRRAMMTGRYTLPSKGWGPLDPDDTTIADMLWGKGVHTGLIFDTPPMRLPKYGYQRSFYDVIYGQHGHELDYEYYRHDAVKNDMKYEDYLDQNIIDNFRKDPAFEPYIDHNIDEINCILRSRQNWKNEEESMHAAVLVNKAKAWLEERTKDKEHPFFLWFDCFDPHEPFDPTSVWENFPCPYDPDYKGKEMFLPAMGPAKHYTEEQLHHVRMLWAEKMTLVDKWVGKLLDKVKELGLWDNTMIILCADHGHPTGHGEHGHGIVRKVHPWPYEELAHIPLIVRMPGVGEGKRNASFVQSVDITPTILDWLQTHQEAAHYGKHVLDSSVSNVDFQGFSLLPLIRGEKEKLRDFAIAGFYGYSWSIIRDDYSFIHWIKKANAETYEETMEMVNIMYDFGGGAGGKFSKSSQTEEMWSCTPGDIVLPAEDQLFDRKTDPFQLKNIIKEKPEVAKELLQQLKLYMAELKAS